MAEQATSSAPGVVAASDPSAAQAEGQGQATSYDTITYPWCKVFCDKESNPESRTYYFHNLQTHETRWDEPEEGFWLWDYNLTAVHVSGLQEPTTDSKRLQDEDYHRGDAKATLNYDKPDKHLGWQGYIPKEHGKFDATKPYAAYHTFLEFNDRMKANPGYAAAQYQAQAQLAPNADYSTTAGFNSRTGGFQRDDQNADNHNDFNKSGRQMNAFFDVDAAANSHEGRSLKAERREIQHTKKEMKKMKAERKGKKQAKRMAFLKS